MDKGWRIASPEDRRSMSELKRTPLHAAHLAAGARMAPFAGWHMPVAYGSQIEEHHAVRRAAGLSDTVGRPRRNDGATQVDVAVIGGGPAGATLATLCAQNGLEVALYERERGPRYRIGESLLPATPR